MITKSHIRNRHSQRIKVLGWVDRRALKCSEEKGEGFWEGVMGGGGVSRSKENKAVFRMARLQLGDLNGSNDIYIVTSLLGIGSETHGCSPT